MIPRASAKPPFVAFAAALVLSPLFLGPLVLTPLAFVSGCQRTEPGPEATRQRGSTPARKAESPGDAPEAAPTVATATGPGPAHAALGRALTTRTGTLELRTPHRRLAHQVRGSGHTHCAPDHSDIAAAAQEQRLMALGPHHRHHFVWITAHNFVAPDPGVAGIRHMFGIEIYTRRVEGRQSPHMVGLFADGSLADPEARPFGLYELDLQEASAAISSAGGLAVLAHPSRYSPSRAALTAVDESLWAVEVLSGSTAPDENAKFIDARLDAGKFTCLSAGGDIHDEDYKLTLGYQVVDVPRPEPSSQELFEAIQSCNFFACGVKNARHGPIRRPAIELREGAILFSSSTVLRSVRFVGRGGKTLHEAKGTTSATYRPTEADSYVRVEAVSADGSARCYSQPTWVRKRQPVRPDQRDHPASASRGSKTNRKAP